MLAWTMSPDDKVPEQFADCWWKANFVRGETLAGSISDDEEEKGSGSHQTEATTKHPKCTITPIEALTGPPRKKIKDEFYSLG